eukprot:COSAG02_NODE_3785_length_6234_cov_30.074817_4_plen_150_part_00
MSDCVIEPFQVPASALFLLHLHVHVLCICIVHVPVSLRPAVAMIFRNTLAEWNRGSATHNTVIKNTPDFNRITSTEQQCSSRMSEGEHWYFSVGSHYPDLSGSQRHGNGNGEDYRYYHTSSTSTILHGMGGSYEFPPTFEPCGRILGSS